MNGENINVQQKYMDQVPQGTFAAIQYHVLGKYFKREKKSHNVILSKKKEATKYYV